MNFENPILTAETKGVLSDGIGVKVIGRVFALPIFPGQSMFNQVELVNEKTGVTMGMVFFQDPMDQDELVQTIDSVARNPEPALYPGYKKRNG